MIILNGSAERLVDLLGIEQNSTLDARHAIETGVRSEKFSVEAPSESVRNSNLLSIYQFRVKNETRAENPRVNLIRDVTRLCNALENTSDEDIGIWIVSERKLTMFVLFVGVQSNKIFGCFSMDDW